MAYVTDLTATIRRAIKQARRASKIENEVEKEITVSDIKDFESEVIGLISATSPLTYSDGVISSSGYSGTITIEDKTLTYSNGILTNVTTT
jgi:hypothetical protein